MSQVLSLTYRESEFEAEVKIKSRRPPYKPKQWSKVWLNSHFSNGFRCVRVRRGSGFFRLGEKIFLWVRQGSEFFSAREEVFFLLE